MKVNVIGPNLADPGEAFHVHAAGCADVKRNPLYRGHRIEVEGFTDLIEMSLVIYADQIEEDTSGRDERQVADQYLTDFRVFPCCTLPVDATVEVAS